MNIYLCGPINGCSDSEAKDWRELVKRRYPEHNYIDPMRNDYRGRENEPGIDEAIVETDTDDIEASDLLLVNYDKPSVGTAMEVLLARQMHKWVLVVAQPSTVISPWLKFHAHAIMPSFAEAMMKVREIRDTLVFQEARLEELKETLDAAWVEVFPDWTPNER